MNKKITGDELDVFLRKHKLWLVDDPYGQKANLCGANLQCENLQGSNLQWANLQGANLQWAKNVNYPIACPEKGSFTGFKKANGHIIELLIPDDALRSSATTRKCRCSKAKVMAITKLDGSSCNITHIPSNWNCDFIYTIGKTVEVNNFTPIDGTNAHQGSISLSRDKKQ